MDTDHTDAWFVALRGENPNVCGRVVLGRRWTPINADAGFGALGGGGWFGGHRWTLMTLILRFGAARGRIRTFVGEFFFGRRWTPINADAGFGALRAVHGLMAIIAETFLLGS